MARGDVYRISVVTDCAVSENEFRAEYSAYGAFMNKLPLDSVLIVVDVQKAFDDPSWGQRNNPNAEATIAELLARWRAKRRPIIHVHHRSLRTESLFHFEGKGVEVKPEGLPLAGEPILYKNVNSSFIGTDLEQRLREQGATTLVIVGLTTDHCVSTTTRMSGNLGFTTYLVADATATFERRAPSGLFFRAEDIHETALASLNEEFATVINSDALCEMM
jgi:nicotinamidase-related amidase